ncbi:MAG: hypothetical protein MRY63_06385 [Neomegalonema sp.]|nr:hypothetical protein [Neomegalonema sp.]
MNEIERQTETAASRLYLAHCNGLLQLRELAIIIAEGLKASDVKITADLVAQSIYECGVMSEHVRLPVAQFLLMLCYAPEEAGKKFQAEWMVKAASPSADPSAEPPSAKVSTPA